ncbi:hypothetical protein ACFW1A_40205, partial [Kitasatospora sp. NPDC058965]
SLPGVVVRVSTLSATELTAGGAARRTRVDPDPEPARPVHRCGDSAGVGGFLVRLWRTTGDEGALDLAVAAGRAVLDDRRTAGAVARPGLAADGEYLLDLAGATGDAAFRTGAEEFAHLLAARAVLRQGLLALPDGTGSGCGTGTAAALAFLHRLRHGGARLWLDPAGAP